jgi:hypothetical protein
MFDDATAFLSSAISTPLSLLSGQRVAPRATLEEVVSSHIDLNEDEVLEEERGEEAEVDDSPEPARRVRMLSIVDKLESTPSDKAMNRRRWQTIPLRKSNARTGTSD